MSALERIKKQVTENSIMLYMKGTPEMPMCGFSNTVVQVLNHYGADFTATNILEDPAIPV